jgi:putative nucleotidyltransferase with HDIG domain
MLIVMLSSAERDIFEPVTLDQLIGNGQVLPSLPAAFKRVSEQLDDRSCSLAQIGSTIQNDPAITSRILKLVNSSYYGLPGQITSVTLAVNLLGRARCKHVLIGSVLGSVFEAGENPAFSIQAFWQHSIKTALIARQLADYTDGIEEPEAMFTAGLLHDIGKLMLIERFPQQMLAAEETMIRRRIDELSAELSQVGLTHTAVGAALMQHWGLPDILVECARFHNETVHDGPNRRATHLVYLANRLSEYVPPLDDSETLAILDDIPNWDMGQVSIEQIATACQVADDLVFEVMESLGMVPAEIDDA